MVHLVKSVGVMSAARISGLLYGCLGLLFVPFFLVMAAVAATTTHGKTPFPPMPFAGMGIMFALFFPVFYGVMGFVFGAVGALVYNLLAKWVGGFELELSQSTLTNAEFPSRAP